MTNTQKAAAYLKYNEIDHDFVDGKIFVNFTSNETYYSFEISQSDIDFRASEYDNLFELGLTEY